MKKKSTITKHFDVSKYILFEDNHLLVLNKPFGISTHFGDTKRIPSSSYDRDQSSSFLEATKHFLELRDQKEGSAFLGLVQRLDRCTSGTD